MNAVLQKPRAQTSTRDPSASDLASAHGRYFGLRTSPFALRRRRNGAATVLDADFSGEADGASDVENPYTFTGRRLDLESDLMQYRNRYYDPALGRFVSRDPAGYTESYSLYLYASNRPPVLNDAFGLTPWNGGWLNRWPPGTPDPCCVNITKYGPWQDEIVQDWKPFKELDPLRKGPISVRSGL